jgi:hypothetical protein
MTSVVRFYKYGDPSVMKVENEKVGGPGPGQVRLRQQAISTSCAARVNGELACCFLERGSPCLALADIPVTPWLSRDV